MRIPFRLRVAHPVRRPAALIAALAAVLLAVLTLGSASALAAAAGPVRVHVFTPLGPFSEAENADCEASLQEINTRCDFYQVTATNFAAQNVEGPIVVSDVLPAGLTLMRSEFVLVTAVPVGKNGSQDEELGGCSSEGAPVVVTCTFGGTLEPDGALELRLRVTVAPGAVGGAPNTVKLAVPGSPEASLSEPIVLSSAPSSFGPSALVSYIASPGGTPDTQAGDHPYEMTTRIDLHSAVRAIAPEGFIDTTSVHDLKDVVVDLPVGVVGDAQATPQCTFAQLASAVQGCPADTRVGQLVSEPEGFTVVHNSVYNMVPEHGVAAEFGFNDGLRSPHAIYASLVPTPAGYVVRATTREVPQVRLTDAIATFYGDPAARAGAGSTPVAMFTNPSDCSGRSLTATAHLDSWQEPGVFSDNGTPPGEPDLTGANWVPASSNPEESPPVTGCNLLRFEPSAFTFAPEAEHRGADEPAGYESVLRIPQSETPGTLATPPLKTAVVTLPPGVAISPSGAEGLLGCQENGPEGINFESPDAGHCPAASNLGKVEVVTPLLEEHLTGSVFVAQPKCGGPGQPQCSEEAAETGGIFAIYLEVGSENTGIHVKLKGSVEVGGEGHRNGLQPGQLRTSFIETPQVAVFSELRLKFNGGPRAPLANPQTCGTFTTNANLEPWSAPESGPNAVAEPTFDITGCAGGFAPSFIAGMTSTLKAGAYSPFTLTFSRHDREQDLSGLTVNMPEGLLGKIAAITQCPEAAANAGSCGSLAPGSRIGTATAAAGSGSHPFWQSGEVYLTGPYKGGPFGLSVVVPAVAGPYNLGLIVLRAAIYINPITAAVTVVSDPLPQAKDGVPLRVQTVNVTVGQEDNFTFNPTNCTPSAINATVTSAQGQTAPVSTPFAPTSCQSLPFHPELSASTSGRTSKANGASFNVKIGFHAGEANIHRVELTIPSVLPSRLTTIQKACRDTVFNVNPASCPPESLIATATARTPLLPDPLSGPVYFVSHGGAAFPDTEIVLQGDNVKLILDGHTDIKKGVTYSRFETVPDAPVSSFEFKAPEGRYSIFGAFGNLCQKQINAPTRITAQNGAVFSQETPVEVENCPNTLSVLSHRVKGRSITVTVAVPAAGTLTATGKGLSKATRTSHGRGTLTLTLKATRRGRVNTKVKLSFAPTHGKHLTATVAARIRR